MGLHFSHFCQRNIIHIIICSHNIAVHHFIVKFTPASYLKQLVNFIVKFTPASYLKQLVTYYVLQSYQHTRCVCLLYSSRILPLMAITQIRMSEVKTVKTLDHYVGIREE